MENQVSFPLALNEAAQSAYFTYCGVLNTRGLMPVWADLPSGIRANWLRMMESSFEVFARHYGVKL